MIGMKLKHALIPYVLIIVILPAILVHLEAPFGISPSVWNWILDGLMAAVAVIGLIAVIIKRKKKFKGWIALLVLAVFFLLPQLYLWKTQDRGFYILRQIYRFALLFITLFVIPLEIHLRRRDLCILIGCFVIYGLICCVYEVIQHPTFWDSMAFFTGKGKAASGVESFFEQKNRFGGYLALWIVLCVFAVQISHNKLWLIPAVIFGVFLVATESRGGLLLVGVFLLVMLVSYHKRLGASNTAMIFLDIAVVAALLLLIPTTREFIRSIVDVDRGVTGRDKIWQVGWNFYREANPFLGHGIGVQIERVMIERLSMNVSTHNVYLYILNSGGICLVIFYILSFVIILNHPCYRHHYLIPLLIAVLAYGFFELACAPFDFWHLSNMFTVCLFFIPGVSGLREHRSHHHHHHHHDGSHTKDGMTIYSPEGRFAVEDSLNETPEELEMSEIPEPQRQHSPSSDGFDFEQAVAEEKERLRKTAEEGSMSGTAYGNQPYGNVPYNNQPYGAQPNNNDQPYSSQPYHNGPYNAPFYGGAPFNNNQPPYNLNNNQNSGSNEVHQ